MRKSKRPTIVTVFIATVAAVIKIATTVKVRYLSSGVGRLPHLAIQPRSVAESGAFSDPI
jgi:hypothetical protein